MLRLLFGMCNIMRALQGLLGAFEGDDAETANVLQLQDILQCQRFTAFAGARSGAPAASR
jgi:hypothetical protein